ncbi:cytochrome-c peroxidase [Altibacter sp. HG106]|uniref:cytochrome-c peroxidase n=1 Tax=Altibacter sp. HG106 TaxID=3023937 RepID=UPI00234FE424|nr:cytochrome c peroxidase [Altibacter sp. HG106]MDC7994054.1 cytochrome c peroxidase [Altibacter sp. HG106]
MRSDTIFLFGSILLSAFLMLASKPSVPKRSYVDKAIGHINRDYREDLTRFTEATEQFEELVTEIQQGRASQAELEPAYRKLRDRFKTVSFLLEYLDKEAYDKFLNGAPLPKLEPKVSDFAILEPKGLQVIDELMAAPFSEATLQELSIQAHTLRIQATRLAAFVRTQKINDRQFLEASRQAILRLTTLGITGFDTPGTLQGVEDSNVVLQSLQSYFKYYEEELKQMDRPELLEKLTTLYSIGIERTQNTSFNTFNRLRFIKEVANPIYKTIKDIHTALQYETIQEVSRFPLAVNSEAAHLFAPDFLNEFYYVSIDPEAQFDALAALGKKLFHDPILSTNNRMSCASCHAPEKAFTDGLPKSANNRGGTLARNAMTLNYSVYASGYFHDMRTKRLEDQFEHVILSKEEFNTDYQKIIEKLKLSPTYQANFQAAFPKQSMIRPYQIDYALAAYVMQLNAFNSKLDAYFQGKISELTSQEERGFNLFTGKAACATCHFMPLFSGTVPPLYTESESEVLGVPAHKDQPLTLDSDIGRLGNGAMREVAPFFKHAFKTPTVRNIDKTAPYMHNGIYDSLEEVMEFYNEGGGAGRGMVLENQTLAPDPLDLSEAEIDAIVAFMKTLTDKTTTHTLPELPRDFSQPEYNDRKLLR